MGDLRGATTGEGIAWVLAVAIALLVWINWPLWGDGVRVYIGLCETSVAQSADCPKWNKLYQQSAFVADFQTQRVIKQVDGLGPENVGLGAHCVVRDQKNWRCISSSPEIQFFYEHKMVDGVYWETAMERNPTDDRSVHQLPRWRWLWLNYVDHVPVYYGGL